jgi:hypothetical protein
MQRRTWLQWGPENHAILFGWTLEQAVEYLTEQLQIAPPVCRPQTWREFQDMGPWGPAIGEWDGKSFKKSELIGAGAGQTCFSKAWPKLAATMTEAKVREALVGPWKYYDRLGQRWDAAEHVEHGSQWGDPSSEGSESVHGANRLAVESLPLMPSIAIGFTIGWDRQWRAATWPIWRGPLDLDAVCVAIRQPMRERLTAGRSRIRGPVQPAPPQSKDRPRLWPRMKKPPAGRHIRLTARIEQEVGGACRSPLGQA